MLSLGIDIGTSTVKLVLLKNQEIEKQWMAVHHGNPFVCLKKGLSTLELAMDSQVLPDGECLLYLVGLQCRPD